MQDEMKGPQDACSPASQPACSLSTRKRGSQRGSELDSLRETGGWSGRNGGGKERGRTRVDGVEGWNLLVLGREW